MNLNSKITTVPKIGPKYQKLLKNLEITNVGDLIYHFPFRYDDYSITKNIKGIVVEEPVTITGELVSIKNIYTSGRKRITKAIIEDGTGKVELTWFNMHYIKNSLKEGEIYNVSGKASLYNNKVSFISPEVELESRGVNTKRLVPIYPQTHGISSKWIRTRINDVIGQVRTEEMLPEKILKKYNFYDLEKSLNKIHFPENKKDIDLSRKRFGFEEVFLTMLKVEQRKISWKEKFEGYKVENKKHQKKIDKFIENLPFTLTTTQVGAVKDITKDMEEPHPMNRLLEGDVGSGKTIVAVIASYLCYLNGYKVLYMAPTEILAIQHHETFQTFLKDLVPNISLKTSRSKNASDFDIAIGTHALIHLEDEIENIGLVVIDEQQRFGVKQRAKLMEIGKGNKIPHLLTMTATPIPRTLALTLYGDIEISKLEANKDRYKNTKTWIVGKKKREDAFEWVAKQNLSTFVVCPLIGESEYEMLENVKAAEIEYERLKNGPFKKLKIGLLHGKMKSEEKEKAVNDFRKGNIQVLVSTPVIEVGIDIPDASIIMIESAERYGLASLHQLRGRIGRRDQEAFCMLFMSKYSRDGSARLKNMEKHTKGIKLAEIDLERRGQGDLYGFTQHGFVNFRFADPSDFDFMKNVKSEAQKIYKNIEKYPSLKKILIADLKSIS